MAAALYVPFTFGWWKVARAVDPKSVEKYGAAAVARIKLRAKYYLKKSSSKVARAKQT